MKHANRLLLISLGIFAAIALKLAYESWRNPPVHFHRPVSTAERFIPSALRLILADVAWLQVTTAWQEHNWLRVESYARRALWLRPEEPLFFELAGWHLAWNAALDVEPNSAGTVTAEPGEAKRWILKGEEIFCNGIVRHPKHWPLYQLAAMTRERLGDWEAAATWYESASTLPYAPAFLQRLVAGAREKAKQSANSKH